MLVITLITEAWPSAPTWMTLPPIASSMPRWAAKTASSPPAITVISPAAALWTPPVTGHASVAMPRTASSAASRSSSCASLVLMSIQVPPARRPSQTPSGPATTAATAAGDGRQVITQSDASRDGARRCHCARAGGDQRVHGGRVAVVDGQREAGREHAGGEVAPQIAEPDEADVHVGPRRSGGSPGSGSRCRCASS